jgi:hypothetical protein
VTPLGTELITTSNPYQSDHLPCANTKTLQTQFAQLTAGQMSTGGRTDGLTWNKWKWRRFQMWARRPLMFAEVMECLEQTGVNWRTVKFTPSVLQNGWHKKFRAPAQLHNSLPAAVNGYTVLWMRQHVSASPDGRRHPNGGVTAESGRSENSECRNDKQQYCKWEQAAGLTDGASATWNELKTRKLLRRPVWMP